MASSFLRRHSLGFPASARDAGASLWIQRAVDLIEVTETDAEAAVAAHGIVYRVRLRDFDDAIGRSYVCSCRPTSPMANCHHVWAALMKLGDLLDGIEAAEASLGRPETTAAERSPVRRVSRSPSSWQQRLARFVQPRPEPLSRPAVIEYYVEDGSALGEVSLVIHVRERQPKKNGELGIPRATRLSESVTARLSRADQILLGLMQRASRRSYYSGYPYRQSGDISLAAPWPVTNDEAPVVLPFLAQSERVYVAPVPAAGEVPRRLTVDVDEPFSFEIAAVPRKDAAEEVDVHAMFRRGELAMLPRPGRLEDTDFVIVEDRLVRIECHGAGQLVAELANRGPITVPKAELPQLLGVLAGQTGARHFLRDLLAQLPARTPVGVVTIEFPKDLEQPLPATVQFDYDGVLVPREDERPVVDTGGGVCRRDTAGESALVVKVVAAGCAPSADGGFECPRARFVEIVQALTSAGLRVLAEGRPLRTFRRGAGSVHSGIDWFEIGGNLEFDGHTASLPELLAGKILTGGLVELGDGSVGMLPSKWLQQIETLRLLGGEVEGDRLRLPASRALLLDAMLAVREEADFEVDARFAQMRRRLATFTKVEPIAEPAGFTGSLRPYQRDGLGWLQFLGQFGLGGCLADDMGLGKTVQVLAMLVAAHAPTKKKARRAPSLLVAPRSVLSNWQAEAQRFAPQLRIVDFSGPERWSEHADRLADCDLVLTTYGVVRADAPVFVEKEVVFTYAILDEAQAIKNPDSQSSKAARLVRAMHRLVLTGTPVENHLGDLWSLFEFLNPGMLGRLPAFRGLFGKDDGSGALAANRELVQRALRPVLLRRTKGQVLKDLPEKVEQTIWCDMGPEQRKRYDALRKHYQKRLLASSGELANEERFLVLEALLRLRQAACHEGLLVKSRRQAESAKFEDLLPRLEDLAAEGHKALVFSQFTSLLDLLEPRLRERGLVWERLDGSTRDRAARVERFQTDTKCPVFLISLKAGGYGLNLTAAGYVFLLDPWWNPAVEMQAIHRAHRIGQKRVVHACRMVCRGTVEERVLELQAKKRALCEAILGNERSLLQDLTRADLALLLG